MGYGLRRIAGEFPSAVPYTDHVTDPAVVPRS